MSKLPQLLVLAGVFGVSFSTNSPTFSDISFASFASGDTGFKFLGGTSNAYLGDTVAPAGDFNGDGVKDMLFTSGLAKVFVLFGRSGASPFSTLQANDFTASDTNGFTIYNIDVAYGLTASGVGDLNKDGFADIAIAAPAVDYAGRTDCGVVYILFGRSSGIADVNVNNWVTSSTSGFRIYGEKAFDHLGVRIVNLGDFNGDGTNDIVLWAEGADNTREAGNNNYGISYVIFGDSTRVTDLDMLTGNGFAYGTAGFRSNSYWGISTFPAACGDFNNDGYADLALPSKMADGINGHWAGNVWVLFGHSTATTFADIYLENFPYGTGGFVVQGAYDGDSLGTAVSSAGDFNGDGLYDMLIASASGKAYILFGRKGVTSYDGTLDLRSWPSAVNKGQLVRSAVEYINEMFAVSNLGDFNGDGITDVAVTAVYRNSGVGWAGVLFGHRNTTAYDDILVDSLTAGSQGFNLVGAHAGARLGNSVAGVGDVNGDGFPDMMVGSVLASTGGLTNEGAAYVIYGKGPPTASPTARPTAPTSQPSSQPSTQPSVNPATLQSILASPTYKVKNGFAFAAVGAGGKVSTWGEAQYGGDASAVQSQVQSDIAAVVGSRFAFAAVTTGGSLALWGVNTSTSGLARYGSLSYSVGSLVVANDAAFGGVDRLTGRVIAIGSKHHGGDVLDDAYCNGYSAQLSAGVRSITASAGAFAAIKTDRTLLCWGNKHAGANIAAGALSALVGAKMVVATMTAFAVLLSDNTVVSWGDSFAGGDSSAVTNQLREVHHLTASRSCFVAFKKSSGVVVWGYGKYCGDTSAVTAALSSHVTYVAHTYLAMAALKADGTVVAWGKTDGGGDASTVQASLHGITHVHGNSKAFAALTSTGGVVAWGRAAYGGSIPSDKVTALSSGVVSIAHADRAFAALKNDGSVVVWGQAGHGGEPGATVEALLTSGVHTICANDVAFSAIKTDGSVVAWGHSVSVPVAGVQFTSSSLAAGAQCA